MKREYLFTSDKDFGEMIFKNKMKHHGIILLRLSDERPPNKITILKSLLKSYAENISGNFVVVTEKVVRLIKLS